MNFRGRQPAPKQVELMALLDWSPLPWTHQMLMPLINHASLQSAVNNQRVWRIERGLYTSTAHRPRLANRYRRFRKETGAKLRPPS